MSVRTSRTGLVPARPREGAANRDPTEKKVSSATLARRARSNSPVTGADAAAAQRRRAPAPAAGNSLLSRRPVAAGLPSALSATHAPQPAAAAAATAAAMRRAADGGAASPTVTDLHATSAGVQDLVALYQTFFKGGAQPGGAADIAAGEDFEAFARAYSTLDDTQAAPAAAVPAEPSSASDDELNRHLARQILMEGRSAHRGASAAAAADAPPQQGAAAGFRPAFDLDALERQVEDVERRLLSADDADEEAMRDVVAAAATAAAAAPAAYAVPEPAAAAPAAVDSAAPAAAKAQPARRAASAARTGRQQQQAAARSVRVAAPAEVAAAPRQAKKPSELYTDYTGKMEAVLAEVRESRADRELLTQANVALESRCAGLQSELGVLKKQHIDLHVLSQNNQEKLIGYIQGLVGSINELSDRVRDLEAGEDKRASAGHAAAHTGAQEVPEAPAAALPAQQPQAVPVPASVPVPMPATAATYASAGSSVGGGVRVSLRQPQGLVHTEGAVAVSPPVSAVAPPPPPQADIPIGGKVHFVAATQGSTPPRRASSSGGVSPGLSPDSQSSGSPSVSFALRQEIRRQVCGTSPLFR